MLTRVKLPQSVKACVRIRKRLTNQLTKRFNLLQIDKCKNRIFDRLQILFNHFNTY